jgi:hypothetical protein
LVGDDALRVARELAASLDPTTAAERCGALFESDSQGQRFCLSFLGADVEIGYPQLDFGPSAQLPPHVQALLVYYLATCDGSRPTGEWHAFADLPDGRFYSRAFQGYTGDALSRRVGERSTGLSLAVEALGGRGLSPAELATNADCAWVIPALPRVPVAVVWWDADDEFPSRAELLFDATAPNHLPTDGCAVLGSWLTGRLAGAVESGRA